MYTNSDELKIFGDREKCYKTFFGGNCSSPRYQRSPRQQRCRNDEATSEILDCQFSSGGKNPVQEKGKQIFFAHIKPIILNSIRSETILAYKLHCKFDFHTAKRSAMCLTFIPVHPLRFIFPCHSIFTCDFPQSKKCKKIF